MYILLSNVLFSTISLYNVIIVLCCSKRIVILKCFITFDDLNVNGVHRIVYLANNYCCL